MAVVEKSKQQLISLQFSFLKTHTQHTLIIKMCTRNHKSAKKKKLMIINRKRQTKTTALWELFSLEMIYAALYPSLMIN